MTGAKIKPFTINATCEECGGDTTVMIVHLVCGSSWCNTCQANMPLKLEQYDKEYTLGEAKEI